MLAHIPLLVNDKASASPCDLTIFCMVDGPGATWRLSFELPLRQRRRDGSIRLICLEERAFSRFDSKQIRQDFAELLSRISPDIVVLSRCNSLAAIILTEVAGASGLPILYHIDDDLFAVPRDLGRAKYEFYNNPLQQAALRTCCEAADLVYCSTEALSHRLGRFGFGTPRVFGEIYCPAIEPFASYAPKRPPVIGYMGTGGHHADLELVVSAISSVMADDPRVSFEILGTVKAPPQLMKAFPGRVRQLPPVADYDLFLERMRQLGWAVALSPLKNTAFNAVKANTKFIEYSVAGLPVVVSPSQVYAGIIAGDAGLAAKSEGEWISAIHRLLNDPRRAAAQVERAQARLRRDFSLEKLENQLLLVLARVLDERRRRH